MRSCWNNSGRRWRVRALPIGISTNYICGRGMNSCGNFWSGARNGTPPEVIETERRFELQMGETKLAGRVDRIDRTGDDTVCVVDYKTGKPKSQEEADESLQLSLYALAAKEAFGKRADRLVFFNLENNTPVVTRRNDAQLEEAKLRVLEAAECIAAGEFGPKQGYQCRLCPYRNLCPATEKALHVAQKNAGRRVN